MDKGGTPFAGELVGTRPMNPALNKCRLARRQHPNRLLVGTILRRTILKLYRNRVGYRTSLTSANSMSEHQIETAFLRRVILYDDSEEPLKLNKSIAQVQQDERCVQRMAAAMALFLMLGLACVGYGVILQENFPYNLPRPVINVFCGLVLASMICLVAFAGLLAVYRMKLNRLREECRRLVARLLESHLGKPHIPTLAGSHRGADDREAFQRAAKSGARLTDSLASSICAPELKAQ